MYAVPGRHRESGHADEPAALGRGIAERFDAGDERCVDLRPRAGGDEPGQAGAEAFPRGSAGTGSDMISSPRKFLSSRNFLVSLPVPAFAGTPVLIRIGA